MSGSSRWITIPAVPPMKRTGNTVPPRNPTSWLKVTVIILPTSTRNSRPTPRLAVFWVAYANCLLPPVAVKGREP
jgi:hypothetical protein